MVRNGEVGYRRDIRYEHILLSAVVVLQGVHFGAVNVVGEEVTLG